MNGCTNPAAVNYDAAATVDDGSCIYLTKQDGVCYAFQDVGADELEDESFTVSFSLMGKDWVFFHDYIPDFLFSDREHLYSLKGNKIYRHNQGAPGVYYDSTPKSFFIDAIFASDQDFILNSVQWITEVLHSGQAQQFSTLTHITIWDSVQCTGRIALTDLYEQLSYDHRKLQGVWSFDTFRDMVTTAGSSFLKDIFQNFAVDTSQLSTDKPWFEQELLQDNWFCVRLEFDNSSGDQLMLHGADVNASKSYR